MPRARRFRTAERYWYVMVSDDMSIIMDIVWAMKYIIMTNDKYSHVYSGSFLKRHEEE